jgi:hypothetical protein
VIILALDCATKTGWALIANGKVFESGVQDFSRRRGESNGGMFLRFRSWLLGMMGLYTFVVYEQAHHRGGAATEICVNLTGRVQEVAAEHNIEYATYHTASLKKWATGKGKGDKSEMIKAAQAKTGKEPQDDNEADAILLGLMAWEEYGA